MQQCMKDASWQLIAMDWTLHRNNWKLPSARSAKAQVKSLIEPRHPQGVPERAGCASNASVHTVLCSRSHMIQSRIILLECWCNV